MDDKLKLKYRLIDSSTEDPNYPLHNLTEGTKSNGWSSVRFCMFPQDIIIQFLQPVIIKQISIIANEKKIPSMIAFSSFLPKTNSDCLLNYKQVEFDNIGYIKMSTNLRSNFKARELRKVFLEKKALFFKIQLHKNYINSYNVFNQVGLISVEFYGKNISLGPYRNMHNHNNSISGNEVMKPTLMLNNDNELDPLSSEKLRVLKAKMNEAIQKEEFDECTMLKKTIDKVRVIGKRIYELEYRKKVHINNEDFENAKMVKIQIDKLKTSLRNIDKQPANLSLGNEEDNKNALGGIDNDNDNNNESPFERVQSLNNDIDNDMKKNKFSNINMSGNYESFASLGENHKLNASKSQKQIIEDEFAIYDEIILPPVLRKINNQTLQQLEESGTADKGELEDLDPKLVKKYELLLKFIGEEGLKKLFSKQILWKEEGFDEFITKMPSIFSDNTPAEETNQIISMIMKLIILFIEEKHPSIIVKTLQILQNLLKCIKTQGSKIKLNYDFNLTDRLIVKLKEKLGDVSSRVKLKAVDLYCYMLQQEFCDYNNLISELIEEEIKHLDSKVPPKSNKLILGKLTIFNRVFDDLQNAFQAGRTDIDSFPSQLLEKYLILHVSNSKSEIRKLTRIVIKKFIGVFGTTSIVKTLAHVEQRELSKLISEIPDLESFFPHLNPNSSLDYSNNQANMSMMTKARSNSKGKLNVSGNGSGNGSKGKYSPGREKKGKKKVISLNKSIKKDEKCSYCLSVVEDKSELPDHWAKTCLMFTNCDKCQMNVEVKGYTNHKLNKCKSKKEWAECKRCKEAIEQSVFSQHTKDNKCNPAKNKKSANRCPLCHCDIPPDDKGFYTHLITQKCPQNLRKGG